MKVIAAFLLLVMLSACAGPAATQPPTVTPQTPEIPTPATQIPSPTLTPTVQPTRTPRPSLTPIITITEDPQLKLRDQAWDLKATQIASFPAVCDDINIYLSSISPEGNWLAVSCGYKRNQTLEIVRKDGKQWVLQFKDYLAEKYKDIGIPMGGLMPKHWTSDDAYLYFASFFGYDGGGDCFYGHGDEGLFRINVNNGRVSTILSPSESDGGYGIAFSSGGVKMVFNYNAGSPTILDFRTGEKLPVDAGDGAVGDLTWSPDSSELAYATCQVNQDYSAIVKSSIRIYSLDTHTSKTILDVEGRMLSIDSWDANSLLKIEDCCFSGNPNDLVFDGSSDEFITLTPTPTP